MARLTKKGREAIVELLERHRSIDASEAGRAAHRATQDDHGAEVCATCRLDGARYLAELVAKNPKAKLVDARVDLT